MDLQWFYLRRLSMFSLHFQLMCSLCLSCSMHIRYSVESVQKVIKKMKIYIANICRHVVFLPDFQALLLFC